MQILVVNQYGNNETLSLDYIPRIGDKIDIFYRPFPTVSNVLLRPTMQTLKDIGAISSVDAIVTVE